MIKLLRKLFYKPTVVKFHPRNPSAFRLYPDDDFGRRWRESMDNGELPRGMTEAKLIECLVSFHYASVQEREYELRHLLHYGSMSELRVLSTLWWGIVIKTSWVQVSTQRLSRLQSSQLHGRALMASPNNCLACGILTLHLHLHQRDAMSQLPFFIVQCEDPVPRLGKAAPYLAKAARRLQRSYGLLPRFRSASRDKLTGSRTGDPTASMFDELAKLIGDEEADE